MNSKLLTVLLTGAAAGALVGFLVALEKGMVTGEKMNLSSKDESLANDLTTQVIGYLEKFTEDFLPEEVGKGKGR